MKDSIMQLAALILVCTILCAASCKKEDKGPQLPPETHIGAYTIGFKVDGKVYTAKGKGGVLSDEHVNYNYVGSDSSINVFSGNTKQEFNFFFSIKYLGVPALLFTTGYPYVGIFSDNSDGSLPTGGNTYNTTDNHKAKVTIKYLYGSSMPMDGVAGTFEMEAVNGNGKIIHIAEGRFDIGF